MAITVSIPGLAFGHLDGCGPCQQWNEPAWAELNGPVAAEAGKAMATALPFKRGFGWVYDITASPEAMLVIADNCQTGIDIYEGGDKGPESYSEMRACLIARDRILKALGKTVRDLGNSR